MNFTVGIIDFNSNNFKLIYLIQIYYLISIPKKPFISSPSNEQRKLLAKNIVFDISTKWKTWMLLNICTQYDVKMKTVFVIFRGDFININAIELSSWYSLDFTFSGN